MNINQRLENIICGHFQIHPYSNIPNNTDFEILLTNYLTMSLAFPYLQAGSQKDIFFQYLNRHEDIPKHVELTTVVGNFLCWDETGGLRATLGRGLKGLPDILNTKNFHASMLRQDCENLLGKKITPAFSTMTKTYLKNLYNGLSASCPIERVTFMVSFERHANQMITALWESLCNQFKVKKESLKYFYFHVGSDDPAEAYHVAMTERLIETVTDNRIDEFFSGFKKAYQLHFDWCQDTVTISQPNSELLQMSLST